MPWLYFPKSDMYLHGYRADGAVTGIIFFLIFIFSIYSLFKKQFNTTLSILSGIMGGLMGYLSYDKWSAIEYEKLYFTHENPLLSAAMAGTTQGIGLYLTGIAGTGIFLTITAWFIFKKTTVLSKASEVKSGNSKLKYIFPLLLIPVIFFISYSYLHSNNTSPNPETLRPVISAEINKMGEALANGDYNTFIDYNHLIMVQSLGGREKMLDLIQSTMEGFKENGTSISRITLSDIYDISKKGKSLQAIITQKVYYLTSGNEVEELQKLIAVSDDNGTTWQYINITGKTKAEMIKFFPSLHPKLKF